MYVYVQLYIQRNHPTRVSYELVRVCVWGGGGRLVVYSENNVCVCVCVCVHGGSGLQ